MTAPAIFIVGSSNAAFSTNSTTVFGGLLAGCPGPGGNSGSATENLTQNSAAVAGTLANLYVTASSNTRITNTTQTIRLNGADTTITVTFGSGVAGTMTDTAHSASVAQNDLLGMSLTTSTGGGSFTHGYGGVAFTASSGTVQGISASNGAGVTLSGSGPITDFLAFVGNNNSSTLTEANAQLLVGPAGTAKYLQMFVQTNGRSTSTVVTFRNNSSSVNQTVTYGSGVTGLMKDTSNTDAIAANDKVACQVALGTGTGNFIVTMCGMWFSATTDGQSWTGTSNAPGISNSAAAAHYGPFGGRIMNGTTESLAQGEMGTPATGSQLWTNVSVNASTTNAPLTFRNAGADKNQVVSITALTTGPFQDTTHSDAFLATDLINYQITNITTGSVTITAVTMMMTTAVNATFNPGWAYGATKMIGAAF